MTPVILAFTACLASAPSECERVTLPVDMSLRQCSARGQLVMAQWIAWQWQETRREYRPHGGYQCSTGERA